MVISRTGKIRLVVVAFVFALIARELGIIDANWYSSRSVAKTTYSRQLITVPLPGQAPVDPLQSISPLKPDEFDVPDSLWDYLPLYKSRHLVGTIDRAGGGGSLTGSYDLEVSASGLCSAREFRRLLRAYLANTTKPK